MRQESPTLLLALILMLPAADALAWDPLPVVDDPLIRCRGLARPGKAARRDSIYRRFIPRGRLPRNDQIGIDHIRTGARGSARRPEYTEIPSRRANSPRGRSSAQASCSLGNHPCTA